MPGQLSVIKQMRVIRRSYLNSNKIVKLTFFRKNICTILFHKYTDYLILRYCLYKVYF